MLQATRIIKVKPIECTYKKWWSIMLKYEGIYKKRCTSYKQDKGEAIMTLGEDLNHSHTDSTGEVHLLTSAEYQLLGLIQNGYKEGPSDITKEETGVYNELYHREVIFVETNGDEFEEWEEFKLA